jgi:hypothetical protein
MSYRYGTIVVVRNLLNPGRTTTLVSMSLQCLLFSSRQETSRPLIQALQELDLGVEHCGEIFAAIRELTSRSFDIIVADLDEGPEAEFLLKTTRELRINNNAFVLAVAGKATDVSRPFNRADLVLRKPLIPNQIKYSLLECDPFLTSYMRAGTEKDDSTTKPRALSPAKASVPAVVSSANHRTPVHRQ